MLLSEYRAQALFQHHFQWKKCTLYSIKYRSHCKPLCPSLIFAGTAGAYPSRALKGLHYVGRIQALFENISLECKWLRVTNNVAYYDTELI
jgi:hypothetical protein